MIVLMSHIVSYLIKIVPGSFCVALFFFLSCTKGNNSYRSYQRFGMQTRRKGQFCIVLTLKSRLCVALNKGIFDSGRNSNNSY